MGPVQGACAINILITTPFPLWAAYAGGTTRTVNIATGLAALGHRVSLLSAYPSGPDNHIEGADRWTGFKRSGGIGYFFNPSFIARYSLALKPAPDLILSSFPYASTMLVRPARRLGIPLIYDAHNVEADRFRQMGRRLRAFAVRSSETYLCRNAAGVLAVSVDDQLLFQRYYGVESTLLPNGVDTRCFFPAPPDHALSSRYGLQECRVVLFFGALEYRPNRDALAYLTEQWPTIMRQQPAARLLVVGRRPPDWIRNRPGIIVTGMVDDIVAHIRLAHIVAVPLTKGGGTRLKIIEALACGQTVLATPFAVRGLPADRPRALKLAEMSQFADALLGLLAKPPTLGGEQLATTYTSDLDWKNLVAGVDWERFRLS